MSGFFNSLKSLASGAANAAAAKYQEEEGDMLSLAAHNATLFEQLFLAVKR